MISQHEIKSVSITQNNEQKCHGHDKSSKRARRHADKKRRQYLNVELWKEIQDANV